MKWVLGKKSVRYCLISIFAVISLFFTIRYSNYNTAMTKVFYLNQAAELEHLGINIIGGTIEIQKFEIKDWSKDLAAYMAAAKSIDISDCPKDFQDASLSYLETINLIWHHFAAKPDNTLNMHREWEIEFNRRLDNVQRAHDKREEIRVSYGAKYVDWF